MDVDGMDFWLPHVLAQCPRAIGVVEICQGQSNVWMAFLINHITCWVTFSIVGMGWHQTSPSYIANYTFCVISEHLLSMRLLAVVKGIIVDLRTQFFIYIKLAHWSYNFDVLEPEYTFFYKLRGTWVLSLYAVISSAFTSYFFRCSTDCLKPASLWNQKHNMGFQAVTDLAGFPLRCTEGSIFFRVFCL